MDKKIREIRVLLPVFGTVEAIVKTSLTNEEIQELIEETDGDLSIIKREDWTVLTKNYDVSDECFDSDGITFVFDASNNQIATNYDDKHYKQI